MIAVGEVGAYRKTEEPFFGGYLQHRSIVVAEMIVGALPEVGFGRSGNFDCVANNRKIFGLACPLKRFQVKGLR